MEKINRIIATAAAQGRKSLSETEVYDIFDLLGLSTPKRVLLDPKLPKAEAEKRANEFPGARVVLKVVSAHTLHKTEAGGVKVCAKTEAGEAFEQLSAKFADAEAIMVCEFVEHAVFSLGQELMLGARMDKAFGPLITLGVGGTDAEAFTSALKPGTSPAIFAADGEDSLENFLSGAWIWKYVSGNVRGGKRLAPDAEMLKWLEAFKKLVTHFTDNTESEWTIEEVEVNPLAVSNGRMVALDGVLRFRKAQRYARSIPTDRGVKALLRPQTVAVAGVSGKKMNMGRIILNNVFSAGFPKEKIAILKDGDTEIDGVKCYPSAKNFPEPVDMYVVSVPSPDVPSVLKDAAQSGKVRGIVLISGGMGEKEGSEQVKDDVLEVIREGKRINPDFSLSGGNSLGIVSNPSKVNTLFIPKPKMEPPLGEGAGAKTALLSQSGAFIVNVISKLPELKPVYSVSVGNQMDVTVVDYVRVATQDDEIKALLVYIEGLKEGDGLRLVSAVKKAVAAGKRVVIYKAGRTPAGQKAVMGHTASIAGSFVVARTLLSQAGAIVAETLEDFEDYAQMCAGYAQFKLTGTRAFIMSNAGFETSGMADNITPQSPIRPEPPSKETAHAMAEVIKAHRLDGIVDVRNPFDITPMGPDAAIMGVAELALKDPIYDCALISMVPLTPAMKTTEAEGLENSLPVKLAEMSRKYGKPIVFCVAAGRLYETYRAVAQKHGLAVFRSADRAIRMLETFFGNR